MFNVGSVQGYLKLNTTGWNTSMRGATASVTALSRTFTRMAAVVVGSLVLIEREFGKFDKAIRHATSVSETTAAQFDKMSDMALDASVKWNKAAKDTAQAFYFLGSAGLSVTEQMQAFNTVIMLSRAMGSELAHTVEGTVDVVRAFGLEFSNIDKIADQLTKTVITSNQTFAILTRALSYASSTARLTNNTLAETTAMLGVMANAGIKGSMAGTVLRRAMTNLMAPTGDMAELVYALGLNIYDTTGKMRPFIDIMGQISDALEGTSARYKNLVFETLFGRRAIAGQIVLFNYGSDALREYAREIENATGTTERVAGKQMKAFTEVLGQLWQELRRVAITAGDTLAPAIERVANSIRSNLKEFRDYIKLNASAVAETLKWTTVIATVLAVGMPLLFVITSLASKMVALALVIANPFVILIAALYTLRAVWKQTSDEMKKNVMEAVDARAVSSMDRFINWASKGLPGRARKDFLEAAEEFRTRGGKDLQAAREKSAMSFKDVWNEAITAVKTQMTADFGDISNTLEGMDGIVGRLMDNLKKYVGALTKVVNIFMKEAPTLTGLQVPAFIFDQEAIQRGKEMRDVLYEMNVEFQKTLKVLTIWEKRWKSGIELVIDGVERWWVAFEKVNKNIVSGWANTFEAIVNDTYGKTRSITNIFEDMFKNILNSFNKLMSQILAFDLWYAMFGQGLELPSGTRTLLHRGKVAGDPDYTATPMWEPWWRAKQDYRDPTRQLGQFSTQKIAPPSVIINNNTGVPMSASKPVFNGKEYVVNVMMEAYNTDPNVRNTFGG